MTAPRREDEVRAFLIEELSLSSRKVAAFDGPGVPARHVDEAERIFPATIEYLLSRLLGGLLT
jgi:hypothetical protein